MCKLHVFLTYFLSHLSSFLLCTISIDRVISVMFLHKAKLLCTPQVAFNVSMVLIVVNFLLSSHILIFKSGYYHPNNNDTIPKEVVCQSIQGTFYNDVVVQKIWKIVDMGIYAFLPFIIMFICCNKFIWLLFFLFLCI